MNNKRLLICRCEEITEREIRDAVKKGARTVVEVKKMTRAGMGICQGRMCHRLVARIISEMTGKSLEIIMPDTPRFPAKPIRVSDLAGGRSNS